MTNEKMWVVDTNYVYDGIEKVIDNKNIVLTSAVTQELDRHKTEKHEDLKFKARQANRFIFDNYEKFHHDAKEYNPEEILGSSYSKEIPDYRIVSCAKVNGYGILTNDLNMYNTAKAFGLEVETLSQMNTDSNKEYTGIHKVYIESNSEDEEKYASIYQNSHCNPYNLLTNQYVIFYDKESPIEFDENGDPTHYKVLDKFKYDGSSMVKLKIPHKKVVQAQNEEQECAIDMLNDDSIPIKFIVGVSGSGKTLLSAKIGIHKILDTGAHSKIIAMRNPIGSGEDIGFLPGDFSEKTDDFFRPIIENLKGGDLEAALMEQRGQLEKKIPYFSKGLTFNNSYVLVDESEDLSRKIIKLLGTRIGKDTCMVFAGDYKQVEDKYSRNNGLIQAIEDLKGNKLVGIVSLSEDIRSEASKVFADLW